MRGNLASLIGAGLLAWIEWRHAWRFWRRGFHRNVTTVMGQSVTWYAERGSGRSGADRTDDADSAGGEDSRPVVVCLHGFLDRGYAFRRLIPVLKPHVRLVIVDLPGFGRSPMPPRPELWTMESIARILAGLLVMICGREPFLLLGHSVGCALSLRLALDAHGARLAPTGIIALAPGFGLTRSLLRDLQHSFFPETVSEVQDLLVRISHDRVPDPVARALLRRWSDPGLRLLARHTVARPDVALVGLDALRRCRLPVLLIRGSDDRLLPGGHWQRIEGALFRGDVRIIAGAGHALHREAAGEIAGIITGAIRRRFLPGPGTVAHTRPRPGQGV